MIDIENFIRPAACLQAGERQRESSGKNAEMQKYTKRAFTNSNNVAVLRWHERHLYVLSRHQ